MLKLITQPVAEPVTAADVKAYLRIDMNDDDAIITRLITTCRQCLEDYLGISMLAQTWELRENTLAREVSLPRTPLQSVTSVTSTLQDVDSVFSNTKYIVDTVYGQVKVKYNYDWPDADYYRIRYVTGYAAEANIPRAIIQGLIELVGYRYEDRDSDEIPTNVKSLVDSYKVFSV